MTFCSNAQSGTVRANGPSWQYGSRFAGGIPGTRPYGGLNPTTPLNEAGIRIDPPMSEPVARVVEPAARAAPEPPQEPPDEYAGVQGVRVTPHRSLWVKPAQQNSGVVVRAWTIPPAAMIRSTTGCVRVATLSRSSVEPSRQGRPAIGCSSLIATGTPSRGLASPRAYRSPASLA